MNTIPNAAGVSLSQVNVDLKFANTESLSKVTKVSESDLPAKSVPSSEQVAEALNVVNKAAVFEQRSLSFMMDETSGRSIVKVMDKSTDQLIRQIPSEELLKVAQDIKRLQEEMGQSLGFLIDRKV